MKYCIVFVMCFLCSCSFVKIKENRFKPQMVNIYFGTELADTMPAGEYAKLAQEAYMLNEIYDAERNNRIVFSPHPTFKNTYVIMWYNKNKEIIKRLQIELYKPIEEPQAE